MITDPMAYLESLTKQYEDENDALLNAYKNPRDGLESHDSLREELHKIIMNIPRDINYVFRVKRLLDVASQFLGRVY